MKTLIISHNPISTDNNMGKTLLSLFDTFDEKDLCQLYIYPILPNIKKCGSYFQITDKMVLESILKFNSCGLEVKVDTETAQSFDKSEFEEKAFTNKKNKRELKLILRSLIWKMGFWYNKSLKNWIEREKPDVIFATGGVSSFFYPFVMKIARKHNLPIVAYVCDDFFFCKTKKDIISKIYYRNLKKNIHSMMHKSCSIISICEPLSQKYNKFFNVKTDTIYTGVSIGNKENEDSMNAVNISYFGNLFIGRNTSLAEVGTALDAINKEQKTNFKLNIYTNTKDEGIKTVFEGIDSISVQGFVSSEKVIDLMNDSVLLLHVEGFEEDQIERVRYSISTKIPESLNSGVCLFAYGPSEDASIDYLHKNDCAIVSKNKSELKKSLEIALFDAEKRKACIRKAKDVARNNHDKETQSKKLKELLNDAVIQHKNIR